MLTNFLLDENTRNKLKEIDKLKKQLKRECRFSNKKKLEKDIKIKELELYPDENNSIVIEGKIKEGENILKLIKENISEKERKKINNILSPYIKDITYKIRAKESGLYKIYTESKEGKLIVNTIDPYGIVNGGTKPTISVETKMLNNDIYWVFAPFEENKNIAQKLLTEKYFCCNIHDVNNVKCRRFSPIPFSHIDMTNTKWMDTISEDELSILDSILIQALNTIHYKGAVKSRYRFVSFKNIYNFTLISDYKCKVPINNGDLISNINDGFKIVFTNNQVYTELNNDPNTRVILDIQPQQQQPVDNWGWYQNMTPSMVIN